MTDSMSNHTHLGDNYSPDRCVWTALDGEVCQAPLSQPVTADLRALAEADVETITAYPLGGMSDERLHAIARLCATTIPSLLAERDALRAESDALRVANLVAAERAQKALDSLREESDDWKARADAAEAERDALADAGARLVTRLAESREEYASLRQNVYCVPKYDRQKRDLAERDAAVETLRVDLAKRTAEYERTFTRHGSAVEPGSRDEYTEGQLDGLLYALRALGVTP